MAHNRDGAQASRLSSRDRYLETELHQLSVQTSLLTPMAESAAMEDSSPDPEFNEYANRQSGKVNIGLNYGGAPRHDDEERVTDATPTNPSMTKTAATADIAISTLAVSAAASPPTAPTAEDIVCVLLRPQPHAFLHGVLSIQWVIGAIGQFHFDFRASDERYVLKAQSEIRIKGKSLGLSEMYLEWLCGDEEEASPAEQAMLLTKKFFDEASKDADDDADELRLGL